MRKLALVLVSLCSAACTVGNGALWDGTVDMGSGQPNALVQFGADILYLTGGGGTPERVPFEVENGMDAVDVAEALEQAWNSSASTKMCRDGAMVWIAPDWKHKQVSYTVCASEQPVLTTSATVDCVAGLSIRKESLGSGACP